METRAAEIASGGLAPNLGVRKFECPGAPVLDFASQASEANNGVVAGWELAMQRLWHLPHKAIPPGAWRHLFTASFPVANRQSRASAVDVLALSETPLLASPRLARSSGP